MEVWQRPHFRHTDPVVSYTKTGKYLIKLTVTDGTNLSSSVFDTITVGVPPSVGMESPRAGHEFKVNEIIRLRASGTDSTGASLKSNQFSWEVNIQHSTHFHPFMIRHSGNDITLQAPNRTILWPPGIVKFNLY
jgi:hypothetical protein